MPNTIQPGEYSTGSGMEDTLYVPQLQRQPVCPVSVLERQVVELEQQLAGQRLERQQPCCGARNSLKFSPYLLGEFCFWSWPFQPPSIFPISSIFSERAIYFLLSSDLVSQSIIKNILSVSTFLIDRRTYGSFSSRTRKLAVASASMISTKSVSILWPRECLCVLGSIW